MGILFNWSVALGAWALGGPLWAASVFLGVALVRVSLELHTLRGQHSELKRLVASRGSAFGYDGLDLAPESEPIPQSSMRPLRTSSVPFREKMVSSHG
jgi:hypothetical protein